MSRPSFAAAWAAAMQIYDPANPGAKVARVIGGYVEKNINNPDAQGHATLFNGTACYDHCYFNEPGVNYRTDRANFWALQ